MRKLLKLKILWLVRDAMQLDRPCVEHEDFSLLCDA